VGVGRARGSLKEEGNEDQGNRSRCVVRHSLARFGSSISDTWDRMHVKATAK
jgi:hypothetical protein